MSKGYWIGRVDVSNLDAYQNYITANASPFAKYGARFLVRGGSHEVVEGPSRQRNVVIEFEGYQAALRLLSPVTDGDLTIIGSCDRPQRE